jgi:hypothetical protein
MRFGVAVVAALGLLALPGAASADHSTGCPPVPPSPPPDPGAPDQVHTVGGVTVGVYDQGQPGTAAGGRVCVHHATGVGGFHGGVLDVGVGEDPAPINPNDPEGLDFYAVVDGDEANTAGNNQSRGYVGLSSWESSGAGMKESDCNTNNASPIHSFLPNVDNDDDATPSHNSGGCVSVRSGPGSANPVFVSVPVPFVVCGNTTGSRWDGGSTRDGCTVP